MKRLRALLPPIGLLPAIGVDVAGVAGAVLVAIGAGEIYAPAGLIVGGLQLLGGAYLIARRG